MGLKDRVAVARQWFTVPTPRTPIEWLAVEGNGFRVLAVAAHSVLGPNMPERGVRTDLTWLRDSIPAADWQKLEAANTNKADANAFWSIQGRNLAKMNADAPVGEQRILLSPARHRQAAGCGP